MIVPRDVPEILNLCTVLVLYKLQAQYNSTEAVLYRPNADSGLNLGGVEGGKMEGAGGGAAHCSDMESSYCKVGICLSE